MFLLYRVMKGRVAETDGQEKVLHCVPEIIHFENSSKSVLILKAVPIV